MEPTNRTNSKNSPASMPPARPSTGDESAWVVRVRRQWYGDDIATYRLADLTGVRWDTVSGGVHSVAPRPFLHGYVSCDRMLAGVVAHSGLHGPCPHVIKVCVVKKDNDAAVFARLVQQAEPKPKEV